MTYIVLASAGGTLVIVAAVLLMRRPPRRAAPGPPVEPAGMADLAFRRGWRSLPSIDETLRYQPAGPPADVTREIRWLWAAYHLGGNPDAAARTGITWSYGGLAGGLPVFVGDTTISVDGLDLSRYPGGGLVVSQLPAVYGGPVRIIRRPSGLLPVGAWRSGVTAFDEWFRVDAPTPGTATHLLNRQIVTAVAARGDWNFSVHRNWLICLLTAPFGTAGQAAETVDAVAALASTLPRPMRHGVGA
ncbi:hypothetical protein GCM10010399_69960 [Dactylosporangium fulvum]|uniref:Secreted protein n=1 Tax=Dactylosporangium fulvum TaxID=53359 RepID=A0ABY5W0T2_9ACTN|nr:hypothetical protein [Dactylosporangium fulvum]UWP83598.1 hypothetical protein Dfulv_04785 [Dactylosporangium fulvum]